MKTNHHVLVSVIMGIYNCANTLTDAISSIQAQTIEDWEIILCDDGSTDNTYGIASQLAEQDSRIFLIKNEKNMGLNYTLNKCLSIARGKYIARMDGDDRCSPQRFEIEITTLEKEKDISIVSSSMELFDETGTWGIISHPEYPQNHDFIYGSPFCHAPCMVYRTALEKVNGYSEGKKLLRVEDYHLWIKLYRSGYKGKNINLPLYQMRDDRNAFHRRKFRYRINETYVHAIAVKELNLPLWGYIYCIRPLLVGLLPSFLYHFFHKLQLRCKAKS